ncbi:MAG: PA14 domain-containing protein [Parvularculaceae bacterium]
MSDVDFDAAPTATGVVDSLNYMQGQEKFWAGGPSDYFAAQYEGWLVVDAGGSYTFSMASDDGSQLYIDGVLAIGNDGLHGTQTQTKTLNLEAGRHEIEVRYFENGGSQTLQLAWSGPDTGGVKQVIAGDAYEHGPTMDTLSLPEDTTGAVVAELAVSDPDAGDTHSFTVSDDRFEVAEQDGALVLKLKDGESLDYETETAVDVSVTVTDAGGASSTTVFAIGVENTNSGPDIRLSGGEGLKASYFNIGHSLSKLSDIDFDAAPTATESVDSIDHMQGQAAFWEGAPSDYFAAKYEGQVIVDNGGSYTFSMASDDGSQLYIDGVLVIGNDGLHSTQTKTATLTLDPGAHDIEVRFFENGGEATLQLSWSGPDTGGAMQVMGGDDFRLPGVTDADLLGVTENAAGEVAALLSVSDAEGDSFTFDVSDGRFEVVETEAGYALKLKDGVSVDYEAASSIDVTVTATDARGESSALTLEIPVANINEPPTDFALTPAPTGVLALNADGGDDDVALAANMDGFPADALTVEVSFASSQTNIGNGAPLFSYAASNGSDNEVLLFLEGSTGKLAVFLAGTKVQTTVANADLLDGEQHQVSMTWDQASNELKVYVDGGVAFESSINIRDLKSGGTLAFGQEQDAEGGGFNTGQVFEGEIGEVRIFDYARSAGEIADHAGAPIASPETEPGLVNNWLMNADAGGVVEDLVGADHLHLQNGAAIVDGGGFDAPAVYENDAGATVGQLSANDPETGAPVTSFAIVDDPSGAFEVVGSELKLKDGVSLNFEAGESYDVTVRAIGAHGGFVDQTVTVQVANIDEAPTSFYFDAEASTGVLSLNQNSDADDFAIASNLDGFPSAALTVEVSFASTQANVGDGAPLFSYAANDGSNNEAMLFLEGASGKLTVYLAGQKIPTTIANTELLDGELHQVSFSWDQASDSVKVYVDGALEFQTSVSIRDLKTGGTLTLGQEQDTEGGSFDAAQVFKGEITEVRIFDYARTAQEIADHAGGPLNDPETEPGLVNNWVMNDETGGMVEDLAGADNMQLHNGAAIVDSDHGGAALVVEGVPGVIVGMLSAVDPVTGGQVSEFQVVGDMADIFEIVGAELKVKDGVMLDFETQSTYDVTVIAVGSGGESSELVVQIAVVDADEYNYITGTDSTDALIGTAGMDIIVGGDGNDTINGKGGADKLYGGSGDDTIYVDALDTVIDGGDGYDRVIVQGTAGVAIDMAASSVERFDGGSGADVADASGMTAAVRQYGNAGNDTLIGGAGNDVQRGGAGDDVIYGNDGNDNIAGNAGADQLYGGAGDDTIYVDAADTVIDGGAGYDRVIIQGADGVTIDMAASNVERVDGGAGNDYIDATGMTDAVRQYGNAGNDTLIGGAGNDVQRGGDGDDAIYGNDGNDNIGGNAGADQLYGGAGDDTIYADAADTVVDGGSGYDRVIVQGTDDFSIDMAASSVERIDGGSGADFADASGMTAAVRQYGNAGNDTLIGGAGNDIQRGGDGDDALYGNGGNDNMRGGAGDDVLSGGAGNDYVYGEDGSDVFVYEMGDGSDRFYGGEGGGWTDTIQLDASAGGFGDYGVDWTVKMTQGVIESSDAHSVVFSDDAHGVITLSDGSTITFSDIEQLTF